MKISEHKICWLCEHPINELYWKAQSINREYNSQYLRCRNCGLVTVSPYLNDPYLSFETTDTVNYVNNIDLYTNAISNDGLRYLVGKMEAKWSAFGKGPRGKLLEVGCAAGYFLFTAQARDWTVQGIELGRSIGEWGIKYLHLPIFIGSFEEADLEEESFDVVVAIEVLEHVLDPRLLLDNLYSKLKPGGMLFLTTPNVYSKAYYPPDGHPAVLEPSDHLNLFSKENLLMLLKNYSFSKINLEFDGPEDIQLQVFAQKGNGKNKRLNWLFK